MSHSTGLLLVSIMLAKLDAGLVQRPRKWQRTIQNGPRMQFVTQQCSQLSIEIR